MNARLGTHPCVGTLLTAVVLATFSTDFVSADDWPAWRGSTGMGLSSEKTLPQKWGAKENVVWRVPLPDRGNSTPVVWQDRLFITQATEKDHRRTVMCFARTDGKLLWQAGVTYAEHDPTNAQNPFCAASPVVDGERVIAYFGSAGVYCFDLNGNELWHRDLGKADSWHGSGSSPVLYQNLCFVNAGPGSNSLLVACDKKTGEIAWKIVPPKPTPPRFGAGFALLQAPPQPSTRPEAFAGAGMTGDFSGAGGFAGSWSTPLIFHQNDHDELIVVHSFQVSSYEPLTGKEIWSCKGLPQQVFTSPVISDNILVASGHVTPSGTQLIAVKIGGSGDVTDSTRLWQIKVPKEAVGSPVIANGQVYLATDSGFIVCIELTTGKILWQKRLSEDPGTRGSWSSPILANDMLLVPNQVGQVFLFKLSPQFEPIGVNSIGAETTCSSLAIANGQIFLRTYEALWCLGAKN
jgi:outer membrane protein assembly factor BamB